MFFQSDKRLFVITDQHTFGRSKINGNRKFGFFNQLHPIEECFLKNVFIICLISNHSVFGVSKDCKSVFTGFLLQIRQHFGVNTPFEQYFPIFGINDLCAVIGQDVSAIVTQLQFLCQRQNPISGPTGGQNNMYSHLLYF